MTMEEQIGKAMLELDAFARKAKLHNDTTTKKLAEENKVARKRMDELNKNMEALLAEARGETAAEDVIKDQEVASE